MSARGLPPRARQCGGLEYFRLPAHGRMELTELQR